MHYAPELTGNAPYTTALARGLRARGHEVRVLTGFPHYPEWRVFEGYAGWSSRAAEDGVVVERKRQYVPRRPSLSRRLLSELSYGARVVFARWGRPDVVLAVSPALFGTLGVALRLRMTHIPAGVWIQDLYSVGIAETGQGGERVAALLRSLESWVLRSFEGVSVIHERFRRHVVETLESRGDRVRVIRNWSHLASPDQVDRAVVRARFGWREGETIVLHAGNMGVKQGLENVVEAAKVADARGLPIRFVLLGGGNQRTQLIDHAGGVERIQFLDSLPDGDFQRALASADVLLVNELRGVAEMSVPSKLTSYFSTGLPIVAAANGDGATASEIAASGGGLRVDAGDPVALVDAVATLSHEPELRRRFGEAGLSFRMQNLSEDAALDSYEAWLRSLILSSRAPLSGVAANLDATAIHSDGAVAPPDL